MTGGQLGIRNDTASLLEDGRMAADEKKKKKKEEAKELYTCKK